MAASNLDPDTAVRPDPRRVRRTANRRAASFDAHDTVHREIGRRLIEHLEPVRLEPRRVLDLGCATGGLTADLHARYPRADVVALDFALARLRIAHAKRKRWRDRRRYVCADALALPLGDDRVDLVCANLLMHWLRDPRPALTECARVMRHGALIAFATLGPDSLKELRELLPRSGAGRLHPLADMHELADALVAAGFSDVVADTEYLSAPYRGVGDLARELRLSGSTYCGARSATAAEPGTQMRSLLTCDTDEPSLDVTYEVVYLHGWYLDRYSIEVRPPTRHTR